VAGARREPTPPQARTDASHTRAAIVGSLSEQIRASVGGAVAAADLPCNRDESTISIAPHRGTLFRLITRGDLIDLLRVHVDQAAALFVEQPPIRLLFEERPTERVAVGQLHSHRCWKLRNIHTPQSGLPASKSITPSSRT